MEKLLIVPSFLNHLFNWEKFMFTNVCMFVGRLVGDVTTNKTANDVTVGNFTLAVESRRYKDHDGKWQSDTQFLDFEIWDTGADNFIKRFHKGDKVGVRASARVSKWTDKETNKERRAVRFRVDEFESLERKATQTEENTDSEHVEAGANSDIPF